MLAIRRIGEGEWRELRAIRLRALADAPQAFATTLAEAERRSDDEWREAALRGASGDRQSTFVAADGERLVGMAVGFVSDEAADEVHLVAMWVDPTVRRKGVGTGLVEAVLAWAHERGTRVVHLAVNETESGTARFYRSLGFKATGHRITVEGRFDAIEMAARPRGSRRARSPDRGSRARQRNR